MGHRTRRADPRTLGKDVVSTDHLLRSEGFSTAGAVETARATLERAGLTNARKVNVSVRKVAEIRLLLARELQRTCGAEDCPVDGRRRAVEVEDGDCETCGGRRSRRGLRSLISKLDGLGVRRVLAVGGSPSTHAQLREASSIGAVEFDLIEGDRQLSLSRALARAERADVVVIWVGTILAHSVSGLFASRRLPTKPVFVARRGVEAFADGIAVELERRMERVAA